MSIPNLTEQRLRQSGRRHRQAGVIMIITLIALLLLAALVLWVLNLGQQVNNKVQAQHAADASVQAGAAWLARSLNTVAANNSDMARYIALVSVLDAMPQSTDFTLREAQAWRDRIRDQLARGGVGGSPGSLTSRVDSLLRDMVGDMDQQVRDLEDVDRFFDQLDVGEMTAYSRDGSLWQAMFAMDEMNQAIMANLTTMVQRAGIQSGRTNLPLAEDTSVVLLPLEPTVPHRRGTFADFERPVRMGLLPEASDDPITARGPWDAVFGWRERLGYWRGGTRVPGSSDPTGDASGKDVSISRGSVSGARTVGAEFIASGYRTYGPFEWLKSRVHHYSSDDLYYTRLGWYEDRVADHKLAYVFPDPLPDTYTDLAGLARNRPDDYHYTGRLINSNIPAVIDPDWRITFDEAVQIARSARSTIRETAFVVIEIKSRYAPGEAGFMSPGSWALVEEGDRISPRLVVLEGWDDPRRWGVTQTNDWVWRDDWEYTVRYDQTIGLAPVYENTTNPDGSTGRQAVPQTVYRVDHFIFAGVNVGTEATVTNPYDGFNPNSPQAPAPTELGADLISVDDSNARFEYLTLMSVVRRPDVPQAWPSRFRGGRPSPNMVAIAQAKVFNNHSWDLWTQMWHSELEPVSNYETWTERLLLGTPPAEVTSSELEQLHRYFNAGRDLAGAMLAH